MPPVSSFHFSESGCHCVSVWNYTVIVSCAQCLIGLCGPLECSLPLTFERRLINLRCGNLSAWCSAQWWHVGRTLRREKPEWNISLTVHITIWWPPPTQAELVLNNHPKLSTERLTFTDYCLYSLLSPLARGILLTYKLILDIHSVALW